VVAGLRRGEVCGLRWSSVDLDAATIAITETRIMVHGRPMTSRPTTARGARVLPLPADLVDALHRMCARRVEERRAAGAAYVDSGYVVTDELGQPLSPEVYSDRFARLARAAEVPLIRLHDARHTSVTLERAAGWPDAVTAAWHGHDEPVMRRVYTHVTTEDMRKHARGL
jgi:integrase